MSGDTASWEREQPAGHRQRRQRDRNSYRHRSGGRTDALPLARKSERWPGGGRAPARQGTGILDLASLYVRRGLAAVKAADRDAQEDQILAGVQEGGNVASDLRVLDWQTPEELERLLIDNLVADMERDSGNAFNPERAYELWDAVMRTADLGYYLPDLTISWRGETWYWEHLGLLQDERYRNYWQTKEAWYEKHGFVDRLITTDEGPGFDSQHVLQALQAAFGM